MNLNFSKQAIKINDDHFCYSPYWDAETNQCLKIDLKAAQTQLPGYYILYIVTEKTLDSLSGIVSSVRFKTGSQKEKQAVALNKTGTQCIYQCFPPEWGGGKGGEGGIRPVWSESSLSTWRKLWSLATH